MKILSNPSIYSNKDKYVQRFGTVKTGEHFILTGKGSKCPSNKIRYYWKLVSGIAPSIINIENDGESIFFKAPFKETEIIFELKVKDLETEEIDVKNIVVKVVKE